MTWIPSEEVYCGKCRRMVAAHRGRPVVHHRFNLSDHTVTGDVITCAGWYPLTGMTHGQEDSVAAFWPTEPDTYTEPEADAPPVAASATSAPGARFSFRFVRTS
jgi:hypothetical protein